MRHVSLFCIHTETRRKRVLRRIPKTGDYLPVTSTDGVRSGYMSVCESKEDKDPSVSVVKYFGVELTLHLLPLLGSVSFH